MTLETRADFENVISGFPPYSDFNFIGLHSWNIKDNMEVSVLNHNLVVLCKDYKSDERFLSFIGEHDIDATMKTLLDYAPKHDLGTKLHLIPEHVINKVEKPDNFNITEDRDNHDYIILAVKLSELKGKDYDAKRNGIKKFHLNNLGKVHTAKLEINDRTADEIMRTFHTWRQEAGKPEEETANEELALKRILRDAHNFQIDALGIYVDNVMVAFAIYELRGEYSVGHFMKALRSHSGLYDYLKQAIAMDIHQQGTKYINYEQDLGIEGLRKSKLLLRPEKFLKKYTVSLA